MKPCEITAECKLEVCLWKSVRIWDSGINKYSNKQTCDSPQSKKKKGGSVRCIHLTACEIHSSCLTDSTKNRSELSWLVIDDHLWVALMWETCIQGCSRPRAFLTEKLHSDALNWHRPRDCHFFTSDKTELKSGASKRLQRAEKSLEKKNAVN